MNFQEQLKKYQVIINKQLELYLNKQITEIKDPFTKYCYKLIKEYTLNNGKRIRPACVILSYLASNGKDERKIYPIAVSLELLHTYSLILDDIMDEDDFRRNKPTVYKQLKNYFLNNFSEKNYNGPLFNKTSSKFSVSYAIMLGNLTNILSKKAVLESDFSDELKNKAMQLIGNTDQEIYHGQMLDLLFEYQTNISEKQYLEMTKLKTCVLLGLCFELGALFANADEHTTMMLKEIGINSAFSFQIQDDILDLSGNKGHELGSDIKNKKKTLLMIKTIDLANNEQKKIIKKICSSPEINEAAIKKIIEIMHSTGSVKYCQKLAMYKNNQAKELLTKLNIPIQYKQTFSEFTDFLLSRKA